MPEQVCGHVDGLVCANCSEGIKWFPRVQVEKFSVDQTQFALAKLAEQKSWGRRPVIAKLSRLLGREIRVPVLHGDFLRELFPGGPEDGYAFDAGNSMVNGGLTNIVYLLTQGGSAGGSATAGQNSLGSAPGTGKAVIGVGSGNTAWVATQTALQADNTTGAWYQGMDSGFPTVTTPATINGQVTVASGNGNFTWNEWCWVTGSGTITASSGPLTTAGSVFAGAASMLNRKVPSSSLGSKASGASWVFTQTVTFS